MSKNETLISDTLQCRALRYKFIYSMTGLFLGLVSMLGGIVLFLNGVAGSTSWTAKILGNESTISDAAPGAILFVVGLFVITWCAPMRPPRAWLTSVLMTCGTRQPPLPSTPENHCTGYGIGWGIRACWLLRGTCMLLRTARGPETPALDRRRRSPSGRDGGRGRDQPANIPSGSRPGRATRRSTAGCRRMRRSAC